MAKKKGRGWWGDSARHRAVAKKRSKGKGPKKRAAARRAGRGHTVKGIGKITPLTAASQRTMRGMNKYARSMGVKK